MLRQLVTGEKASILVFRRLAVRDNIAVSVFADIGDTRLAQRPRSREREKNTARIMYTQTYIVANGALFVARTSAFARRERQPFTGMRKGRREDCKEPSTSMAADEYNTSLCTGFELS